MITSSTAVALGFIIGYQSVGSYRSYVGESRKFIEPCNTVGEPTFTTSYICAPQVSPIERELLGYLDLEHDWDGYDGVTPDKSVVYTAINFLQKLDTYNVESPKSMLSGDGEVGLYWDRGGVFINIGFDEKDLYSYYLEEPGVYVGDEDIRLSSELPAILVDAIQRIALRSQKLVA